METLFQKKFRDTGESIREWVKHSRVPLHLSTVSLVLGEPGETPSVENHCIMAYLLGYTPAELHDQLEERFRSETNDRVKRSAYIFSKLIAPSDFSVEESELVDRYRVLPPEKKTTVRNMIEHMGA